MICLNCKNEIPSVKKICPKCFHTVEPIPVPSGGKIQFGGYDWYILDNQDGKMLILTEKVIEKKEYHSQEGEITWEICDLRKYLNGEFYNSFSVSDRARIIEVTNENNDNPWYGTNGGNATTDRIFLLNIEEVVKYFGDSGQLKTKNMNTRCDWCKDEFFWFLGDEYNFARLAADDTGSVVRWRLRSPGANAWRAAYVDGYDPDGTGGEIDLSGGGSSVSREWDGHMNYDGPGYLMDKMGIRPALWLSIV